jgi:hypothetical protein
MMPLAKILIPPAEPSVDAATPSEGSDLVNAPTYDSNGDRSLSDRLMPLRCALWRRWGHVKLGTIQGRRLDGATAS